MEHSVLIKLIVNILNDDECPVEGTKMSLFAKQYPELAHSGS